MGDEPIRGRGRGDRLQARQGDPAGQWQVVVILSLGHGPLIY